MSDELDVKIHPYFLKTLNEKRNRIIAEQAEAALHFEFVDESVEIKEYDEQERLRVNRVITRKIFRGEALTRYTTLVTRLKETPESGQNQISELRTQLDADMKEAASAVHEDAPSSLQRYSNLVSSERWPVVLCMAQAKNATGDLKNRLITHGFELVEDPLLEHFGILKFPCPPEMAFIRKVASLPESSSIADATTPIRTPEPMAIGTQMAESRNILGLSEEMRAQYGRDVTLAVLDTGMDRSHPAFTRVSDEDYQDFTGTGADDLNGHGSHCASIAAGEDPTEGSKYSGVAPKCRLIAGKVLTPGVAGNLESILRGMAWAVFEKHADVLSLSLGDEATPPNGRSIWTQACAEAVRNGTLVCIAAGNPMPSFPESIGVPADCIEAVTVGAIDKMRHLAAFSAMGSASSFSPLYCKPNCVGPGVDIAAARSSTARFHASEAVDDLHVRMSGTSMATPAIAGCMALLKSKARSLQWDPSPSELAEAFYAACDPICDPNGECYSRELQIGHGLVNMEKAFRQAEMRAPRAQAQSVNLPESAHPSGPAPAVQRPAIGLQEAAPSAQPRICYRCGKHYLTDAGVFSPAWVCSECGKPICFICWQIGDRTCERHKNGVSAPSRQENRKEAAVATAAPQPLSLPPSGKGNQPMSISDPGSDSSAKLSTPDWGETFLNRCDFKIRHATQVTNPWDGAAFQIDPRVQSQSFRRIFGQVTQYPLSIGLLKKERFILAAIRLDASAVQSGVGIIQQIAGPQGLDFQDEIFYCVGIFSPVSWPGEWKQHREVRGNAMFYLVGKGAGSQWSISGPNNPLKSLFDPETQGEKKARAEQALASHTRLVMAGDQMSLDVFLEEQDLDRESVVTAIEASGGRFQILEHKGKSYIQKSSR